MPTNSDSLVVSVSNLDYSILLVTLILSGILQGSFLIFLLYKKGFNKTPSRILAALILLFSIHLGLIALDTRNMFLRYPHLSRLSWLLPVLYGPLILLLTRSVIEINFRFKKYHFMYFLPFVFYGIWLTPYFLSSAEEKILILTATEQLHEADFGWMNHLTNYLHIFFVLISLICFYENRGKRTDYFSDNAQINIQWLQEFLWALAGILAFSLLTFYSQKFHLPYLSGIYPTHFVLVVVIIYWTAYKLLLERTVLSGSDNYSQTSHKTDGQPAFIKYSKSGLNPETSAAIARQLRSSKKSNE